VTGGARVLAPDRGRAVARSGGMLVAVDGVPVGPVRQERLRLLGATAGLLAQALLVSVVGARQLLLRRLDERIDRELVQQMTRLRTLAEGRIDPGTGQPFTGVERLLRVHMAGVSTGRYETALVLVDGRPYGWSAGSPPLRLEGDRRLTARWAGLRAPTVGTVDTSAGAVRYVAMPVLSTRAGEPASVFVAASFRDAQRAEVDDTLVIAGGAGCAAWLLAWLVAGRMLAPLRAAGDTAATQRELLDDVGHELATPVTVIRGHLDLLGDDPEERRETIAIVSDELDRINRMVEQLRLLTTADRPGFLRPDPFEVAGFTAALLGRARALGDRDWRLETTGVGPIVADRQRLTQAVMQLVQNAVRHTPPGARIGLGSEVGSTEARFWVRDRGPGIADADQQRIFDRFTRAGAAEWSDGTGLGLTIVQAIAVAHHGRVELDSLEGAGALFTLVVPVAPPNGKVQA
jgi:two-component system OmpR family sensor kinase